MSRSRRHLGRTLAVAAVVAGGFACEPVPPGGEIVLERGPPAPLMETVPPDPYQGFGAWIPGRWYWDGQRYSWARGWWSAPRSRRVCARPNDSGRGR
jgi:hypothetical protein